MDGMRALSVSNTTPTDTGNPPEAVMSGLCGILKIKQTKTEGIRGNPLYNSESWEIENIKSFAHY